MDGFSIKYPMEVDMPLYKETQPIGVGDVPH